MIKNIFRSLTSGLLLIEIIINVGCASTATIKKTPYAPFLKGKPISEASLEHIKKDSPKDAVFADLLQAFALMRTADLNNKNSRREILGLLETSVSSFEDMTDPENFTQAFSADESKNFRGRSYERMFASTVAGVFYMAENNCEQALPYFRNAEFLDARFQKMPFGTDAPLIYALSYRCHYQKKSSPQALRHAFEGIFRSVRFLTLQETLVDALVDLAAADLRPMAVANRLSHMLYEVSIYYSLITAKDDASLDELLDDAAKNTSIFISSLKTNFDDEYKARMKPLIAELAQVYGLNKKAGLAHLEDLTLDKVALETESTASKLKSVFKKHGGYRSRIEKALATTTKITNEIVEAARAPKMILSFVGQAPAVVRQGAYDEISVVKPGPDATTKPAIRERSLKVETTCGFHRRDESGGFSVVLCEPHLKDHETAEVKTMRSLELMSLSRKATTTQGRKFDAVLKGRAHFRAATEKATEVGAWSAFFLFNLGSKMLSDCSKRNNSEACYTKGYVVLGVAAVTALVSGGIWLIGKTKNPSADSRYIHLMFESVYLSV